LKTNSSLTKKETKKKTEAKELSLITQQLISWRRAIAVFIGKLETVEMAQ
jgi:hypothetical protein